MVIKNIIIIFISMLLTSLLFSCAKNQTNPVLDVELSGPQSIKAGEYGRWILACKAKEKITTGGGIRIAFHHRSGWGPPQSKIPEKDNFISAVTTTGALINVSCPSTRIFNEYFSDYHPWQEIIDCKICEGHVPAGGRIMVFLGDQAFGGAGLQAPTFDLSPAEFRVYVRSDSLSDFTKLDKKFEIKVLPNRCAKLKITIPSISLLSPRIN